jgi:hypothetical protein
MRTYLVMIVAATLSVGTAQAGEHQNMDIAAGTMQVGGTAALGLNVGIPEIGKNPIGFRLAVNPSVGYFLTDIFEVVASAGFGRDFGDSGNQTRTLGETAGAAAVPSTDIEGSFGIRFWMPLQHFWLYLGGDFGFFMLKPNNSTYTKCISLNFPLGVLLPLSRGLGVQIGTSIFYWKSLEEHGGAGLSIPLGYLGVAGFFEP